MHSLHHRFAKGVKMFFFFFNPKYEWLDWVIIYIDLEKDDSRNKGKGRSMAKNTKKKKKINPGRCLIRSTVLRWLAYSLRARAVAAGLTGEVGTTGQST